MLINIPLQSYPARAVKENSQRLVNMYAIPDSFNGMTAEALYPTPGLLTYKDLNGRSIRGMKTVKDLLYIVYDNTFGTLSSSGAWTALGTLNTSSGPVCLASTFEQILIVDGNSGYLYTILANTFVIISDPNFPVGAVTVSSAYELFIVPQPISSTYQISNQSDGTTWQALQFASATVKDGNIVATALVLEQLWLFCETDIEIWFDTGNIFPFQQQQGAFINSGCAAALSIVEGSTQTYWLSQTDSGLGNILAVTGNNAPNIISNPMMANAIAGYAKAGTIADAQAYIHLLDGVEHYVITFPTANKTWGINLTNNGCYEINSFNTNSLLQPSYTRHRGSCFARAYGNKFLGDFTSAKIFILDTDTYTDDGNAIDRIIVTPPIFNSGDLFSLNQVELLIEAGVGLVSGQGSAPLISLEISRDGGYTFGNKRLRTINNLGEFRQRVIWNLIGSARSFVFRFTVTDPIKFIVVGLRVDGPPTLKSGYQKFLEHG